MIDKIQTADSNVRKEHLPQCYKEMPLYHNAYCSKADCIPQYVPLPAKSKDGSLAKRVFKIAVFTSLSVVILLQGAPKKLRSKIDQANKNLIDKNKELGEKGERGLEYHAIEVLKKGLKASKAIFNLAPVKDVLISTLMNKTTFTKNLAQKITNCFEKISFNTLIRSYNSTQAQMEKFFSACDDADKYIVLDKVKALKGKNSTISDVKNDIHQRIKNVREIFVESFTETAVKQRINVIKNHFDGYDENRTKKIGPSLRHEVYDNIYSDWSFFNKKTYTTFVSEALTSDTKIQNYIKVDNKKKILSNSLHSTVNDCYALLIHIDSFIEPDDDATRKIIKNIANHLKGLDTKVKIRDKYLINEAKINSEKLSNGEVALKDEKLIGYLMDLDNNFKNPLRGKYNSDVVKEVSNEINNNLIPTLENPKRGELHQILKLYEDCLPRDKFLELKKIGQKTIDSLDKSVELETDKMFDKIRDLKIGSAPKDTLAMLIPLVAVIYALSKADSKEEKTSVSIRYGAPIAGAVAITGICTVGLVSAGPSLLIGILSGLALNQVGTVLDNLRKNYNAKHANPNIHRNYFNLPNSNNK